MAEIEYAILDLLIADGTVNGLVSGRIFPHTIPQAQGSSRLPAITYTRIGRPPVRNLGGPSGLSSPRIQYTCWATTYTGAKALAKAVREALDGFSGSQSGVVISDLEVADDNDIFVDPAISDAQRRFGVSVDVIAWNNQ